MAATARLYRNEKDSIVRLAVADAIDPEQKTLEIRENDLIRDVVALAVSRKKLGKEFELVKKLSKCWLDTKSKVKFYIGDYREMTVNYGQDNAPLLPEWVANVGRFDIDARSELGLALAQFHDDREALTTRKKMLRVKVTELVNRASTANSLATLWPEGEAYWKSYVEAAKRRTQALVVSPSEVNSLLGIPKEEERACA